MDLPSTIIYQFPIHTLKRGLGVLRVLLLGLVLLLGSVHSVVAQQLTDGTLSGAFLLREFSNPDARISTPYSLLLPSEIADQLVVQEVTTKPADRIEIEHAAKTGLIPSTTAVEISEITLNRGRKMREVRIHTLLESGDIVTGLTLRIPTRERDQLESNLRGSGRSLSLQGDSPFASGTWYKLKILETGIYELTGAYLSSAGVSLTGTPSDRIQIWGRPGVELAEKNNAARVALQELSIYVDDGNDGTFDAGDRILFYAQGPEFAIRNGDGKLAHYLHDYADATYVFLTASTGATEGKRMSTYTSSTPVQTVTEVRQIKWLEEDIQKAEEKIRSGREWLGQRFELSSGRQTQSILTFEHPSINSTKPARVDIRFVGRSTQSIGMQFSLNGTLVGNRSVAPISSYTSEEGRAGNTGDFSQEVTLGSGNSVTIEGTLSASDPGSQAFIDYVRVEYTGGMVAENGQLSFFGAQSNGSEAVEYVTSGFTTEPVVMNVTDPLHPVLHSATSGSSTSEWIFTGQADPFHQFSLHTTFFTPSEISTLSNQNLRGISQSPDYVIITDDRLLSLAQEWAEYRNTYSGFKTLVVTQTQILHEFSAGATDPTAIRDFLKHLYDHALQQGIEPLQHVLLFGDTSHDTRNLVEGSRKNLVLTYESKESLSRINSYASDDYFGLLDDGEGEWVSFSSSERLDIGIGRWPVQTESEARIIMQKTKMYESAASLGSWRTRFTFLADDDFPETDLNRDLHALNADGTAEVINLREKGVRVDKIYMLSYPVENSGGGRRIPQATEAMIRAFNEGSLVMNYSGHGNQFVLADERLFTPELLPGLTNSTKPTIFVTATCQFGRYDDHADQSGAEQILLLANGGAVAALSTTRVVFTSSTPGSNNYGLNIQLTRTMLQKDRNGYPLSLGDIYRLTKNTSEGAGFNARKFALLGDPGIRIGLPVNHITLESLNNVQLESNPDTTLTLRGLDQATVKGRVTTSNGLTDTFFEGELQLAVYNARRSVKLPDRYWVDEGRCYLDDCAYLVERELLFSGRTTVNQGLFETTFLIPRDIRFTSETARILAYAAPADGGSSNNGILPKDASGVFARLNFNGVNPDLTNDGKGPDMDVYLNSDQFVNGTLVGNESTLFVTLNDETGINSSGTGVGHEIMATIDTKPVQEIALNEFYESNLDDFRGGRIETPLPVLPEGDYTLTVRAWDVFNNPSEKVIRFEVADSKALQVQGVANYPNPMNQFTRFYFEHNQPGNPLEVDLRIYTLSGVPVQQLQETIQTRNSYAYIEWNGRDRDFDRLGNGTYLYVLRVTADTEQGRESVQKVEKLVIIR